jgi:hypothetical protein
MIQSLVPIAVTVITAISLAALFWGHHRQREEKRRRKQGIITIPVDAGYVATAGCLGVVGYLGLLYLLLSLSFDLIEQAVAPDWAAWVGAIGLLAGFFIMVGWAAFGIGSSFALTRLVVDKERIRLIRRRRTKTAIFWDRQWQLERMAHLQRASIQAFAGDTEYSLLMRLRQGKKELLLVFDVPGEEVGGLPPYDSPQEGYHIIDKAEWLRSEIRFRHERWEEAPTRRQPNTGINPDELSALAPGAALKNALHFNENELADNHGGLASDSQTGSIRRDQKLTLATYLVLAAAFGAGALYSLNLLLQGHSFDAVGPWFIVLLLAAGFCLLMALITRQHLRSEILVERVSGQIQLQYYRQSDEFWLRVGEDAFHITKQLFNALENEAPYHLYVARYGIGAQDAKLLSAEELNHPK